MSAVVIDLCDDEDDLPLVAAAAPVAAAPSPDFIAIELLDDNDTPPPPHAIRQRGKENGQNGNVQHQDDMKPAARKRPAGAMSAEPPQRHERYVPQSKSARKPGPKDPPPAAAAFIDVFQPASAAMPGPKDPPPAAAAAFIDVTQPSVIVPPPLTPMEQVLEVFPDVDRSHVQDLLNTHGNAMTAVSILASSSSYPKSKTTFVRDNSVTLHCKKKQCKYDFMSASSFEPSLQYMDQARAKLYQEFPCLSRNGVNKQLKHNHYHYAIARNAICQAIMNGNVDMKDGDRQEEQYRLLKSAMTGVHLTEDQHERLIVGKRRTTVLHPRKTNTEKLVYISDSILRQEIEYVQQKEAEWMEQVNMRLVRKQNRAAAEKAGQTMECPCCCFDVAVDEMIACREEGHLFCIDCVRRFAENQIFTLGSFGVDSKTKKPATDLLCMHGEGCSSAFHVEHLRKALPQNIMDKYDELQYRAAVNAAGIELFSCPKCGVQAEIPAEQMIFQCPVAECAQETCKLCSEPAHIPLKCSEVEKKHETKGRLKVEEAISNAKIRTCPKPGCGKKFVKSDGCNKMTCACGTWSCYVCRALIPKQVSYKHFCQTPHCNHSSCEKCALYSNVEEDDRRAMREAGFSAAEEVRGESLIRASDARGGVAAALPSEVRVDVDSLLKDAPGTTAPRDGRRDRL